MSTSNGIADLPSVNSTAIASTSARASGGWMANMRHELVEAQVEVLRMYLEKKSAERLLVALDRLIERTRASFLEEEELMESLTSTVDIGHREKHDAVLAQLDTLRRCVVESDRRRLLAQLILVDRQLTSHISDAGRMPLDRLPGRGAAPEGATADGQAQH